jgi:hypothetical protein
MNAISNIAPPTPAQVLQIAIDKAKGLVFGLYGVASLLEAVRTEEADDGRHMAKIDEVTLTWLSERIRKDIDDIYNHLDNAERARTGGVYFSATEEYGHEAAMLGAVK